MQLLILAPWLYSGAIGGGAAAIGYIAARKAMGCKIDWVDLGLAFGFGFGAGAFMPALGATGLGAAGVGAAFGAAQDVVGSVGKGEPIDPGRTVLSAGLGALGGAAPWRSFATWTSSKYPAWAAAGNAARMTNANPALGSGTALGVSAAAVGEMANTRVFGDGCTCK